MATGKQEGNKSKTIDRPSVFIKLKLYYNTLDGELKFSHPVERATPCYHLVIPMIKHIDMNINSFFGLYFSLKLHCKHNEEEFFLL